MITLRKLGSFLILTHLLPWTLKKCMLNECVREGVNAENRALLGKLHTSSPYASPLPGCVFADSARTAQRKGAVLNPL